MFSKSSISFQLPEDCDFEQQEMTRSKSFTVSKNVSNPDGSVPWYLHRVSDPEENPMLSTQKPMPMDSCSLREQIGKRSSFQIDYWACAIPDSLPPSPDRQSPHWNPNKEYEDLLDYTYPLRPKYKLAKNCKSMLHDSLIHDSGIGLESLFISPEKTLTSGRSNSQRQPSMGNRERFSTPLLKQPEGLAPFSYSRLSPICKMSFADKSPYRDRADMSRMMTPGLSPGCTGERDSYGRRGWNTKRQDCNTTKDTVSSFIRSTKVLPLQKEDSSVEEYLSLPPRLKELETLAQQLNDFSLTVRTFGPRQVQDASPCVSVTGESFPLEIFHDGRGDERDCNSCPACHSQEHDKEDLSSGSYNDCANALKETASSD